MSNELARDGPKPIEFYNTLDDAIERTQVLLTSRPDAPRASAASRHIPHV
jgi:hypothetical protein